MPASLNGFIEKYFTFDPNNKKQHEENLFIISSFCSHVWCH